MMQYYENQVCKLALHFRDMKARRRIKDLITRKGKLWGAKRNVDRSLQMIQMYVCLSWTLL